MKVSIGVSNHHVHLTKEDYYELFGTYEINNIKDLVQTGEFASDSKVNIKTDKSEISGLRVLGPFRDYTQVEISRTDSYALGINPPVRTSGDVAGSETVTIEGPCGSIVRECCILANRHIHINPQVRKEKGLDNLEVVSVKVGGEKSSILNDVYIKETEKGVFEMHLDTDDANACLLKNGDEGEIII